MENNNDEKKVSHIGYFMDKGGFENPESSNVRQSILTMALYNPESKPLNCLCSMIVAIGLDDISLNHMVHKAQEFKSLMEKNTDEVKKFIKRCYK